VSAWGRRFVLRYGWRAYALPILTVITVVALLQSSPAQGRPTLTAARQVPTTTARVVTPSLTSTAPAAQISVEDDSTVCLSNHASSLVLVSISKQHAWMCQGHKQVNSTPVTTGELAHDDHTPTGTWVVQGLQRDRYLVGPGYRDYVQYWIPFNGDFGFHDASWQTMPFGSQDYKTQGSHGCVHLPLATVKWLYGWAKPGSTVVTVTA